MSSEIELYDGRRLLGVVRDLPAGMFAAVIDEQVLGHYQSSKEAANAILAIVRSGGRS